jgi:hypothetical protein
MGFVERHREIRCAADFPVRENRALNQITDFHLLFIRNVHENPRSDLLQLKRFRMRIRGDFREPLTHEVQNLKRAASSRSGDFAREEFFSSKADNDVFTAGVIEHIIRVEIKGYGSQKPKRGPFEDLHRAVAAACHKEAICGRIVISALRFIQIGNRVHLPVCFQIDHF